jgi:hypothetical protein
MREYQVRICERLGVKFPGPTRQTETSRRIRAKSVPPPTTDMSRLWWYVGLMPRTDISLDGHPT